MIKTGLDTTTIREVPLTNTYEAPEYVFTGISANNDYLLGSYLKWAGDVHLMVYVSGTRLEENLKSHLEFLGKDHADVIFVDPGNKQTPSAAKEVGIYYPKTVEELEQIDFEFTYVGLSVSPLDYNYEVMKWCRDHKKTIVGFNPFGGWLSANRNIQSFSVPYLLNFAAKNSDIVMLSGRDQRKAADDATYLKAIEPGQSNLFEMKKTMMKPVQPLKKAVYTSISVSSSSLLAYDEPEFFLSSENVEFFLGKSKTKIQEKIDDLDQEASDYLQSIGTLEPWTLRYKLKEYAELNYPIDSGWNYSYTSLGESLFALILRKPKRPGKYFWQPSEPAECITLFVIIADGKPLVIKQNTPGEA